MTASPDYSQAVADIIDGLGDSPTADEIYHATRAYDVNYLAAAAASEAKAAGGGGGGSQPVGCILGVIDTTVADLTDATTTILRYTTIWDDNWNFNVLPDLPDGLGMTVDLETGAFTITEDGIWIWHVAIELHLPGTPDTALVGGLSFQNATGQNAFGPGLPFSKRIAYSEVMILPAGATNDARLVVSTQAAQASTAINHELTIVRLG